MLRTMMDAGKYRVAHVLMFLLLFLASGGFFIVMAPQYVSVVWLSYYIYRKYLAIKWIE